jgi:hypothetical protein
VFDTSNEFERRYPNIKIPKKPLIVNIGYIFKALLTSFMPIIHIAYFFGYLYKGHDIKEGAIEAKYLELKKGEFK